MGAYLQEEGKLSGRGLVYSFHGPLHSYHAL